METMLVPNLPRDKLEEYRNHWTCDNEVGRKFRFQTESRHAGNSANDKFQVTCLRFLPGTPKALEVYRERVVERFGIFGLSAIKHYLGKGVIACSTLQQRLKSSGVEIKQYELNQVR